MGRRLTTRTKEVWKYSYYTLLKMTSGEEILIKSFSGLIAVSAILASKFFTVAKLLQGAGGRARSLSRPSRARVRGREP